MNPRPTRHFSVSHILLLLATAALCGCGYSHQELFVEGVRTVAVPIFKNKTFYREAEFDLSEALTKEIEQRTPYKVAPEQGADTLVTGTIIAIDQKLLSRSFDAGVPQEVQVTVLATVEWKDLRTGTVLRKRDRIIGTGQYIPARGVGEPYQIAQHMAVAELSRQIVSIMRRDW